MRKKLFPWIKNRRVRHEAISVYKYFIADQDTRFAVYEINAGIDYEALIYGALEYAFNYPGEEDCFNPYTDKKYVDVCWMQVGNKLIDLDEIYQLIIDEAEELAKEVV
ncbi:MAG: hypothetical protein K2K81_10295 [Muribaculaceae bacterium]|nr:hypothetical protein [Muribaculaceae bacterium]